MNFGEDVRYNGRIVGWYDPVTRTYRKAPEFNTKDHIIRIRRAFGVQREIVDWLAQRRCRELWVRYREESGHVIDFYATLADFREFGIRITLNVEDGAQIALPLHRWRRGKAKQKRLPV